jgi:hypothetical protein
MDINENSSNDLLTRDITIPLLLSGAATGVICVAFCVLLFLSQNYINTVALPSLGLIELTPTPAPCPPVPAGWRRILNENFNSNANDWFVGKEDDIYSTGELEIDDGVYRISEKAKRDVYYHLYPSMEVLRDFYLRSNVRLAKGPFDAEYGVVFRTQRSNHFSFMINNAGEVYIYRHSSRSDEDWEMVYRGFSRNIQPAGNNELIVMGRDTHFTFCINRQVIAELDHERYPSGKVGIAFSLNREGDEAVIEFDDLIVYTPGD